MDDDRYDVVVIGGGPAGLSAAVGLGRARRSVLVVDGGRPRNAPAGEVHDYLGRDGTPPADLLAAGRDEVARYGGALLAGEALAARPATCGLHQHQHQHQPGGNGHDHTSWEERYRAAPALWSGRVNPSLVTETDGLSPGRALDVGCGEGGDVLWLAARGWRATGLDWSRVALDRAAEHAAAAGLSGRVTWVRGDVASWQPPSGAFELVTAHFLHPTASERGPLLTRLGDAVAPGGTLLWVGHPYDEERSAAWGADRFATAADVAAELDPARWEIVVQARRAREGAAADGHHDADEVLRARRR